MDIWALRKTKIQFNNRNDLGDEYLQKEYIDSYQIWSSWRDSDINSWPQCLQHFWWKIYDYDSAQLCAKKIKKYYPKDIDLLLFAYWLEAFDDNVIFELSI